MLSPVPLLGVPLAPIRAPGARLLLPGQDEAQQRRPGLSEASREGSELLCGDSLPKQQAGNTSGELQQIAYKCGPTCSSGRRPWRRLRCDPVPRPSRPIAPPQLAFWCVGHLLTAGFQSRIAGWEGGSCPAPAWGGGWGGTAPCRLVKQLPRAISPPGKEARCPRASVSPRGWAAPCHSDAGLCSAPRGVRGHPRGGSGPGRVPQHTAGSRPGTNPYLPPLGRSPGAGCAGCVEPGVPSPSPAATPCASTPGTVTHPRPSAGTSSLRGRPLSPPALRCRLTRCCWPHHAGEGNTQTPQAPATRPLGPPGLGRCKKGGLPSPCWDPSMTLCALCGHSRVPALRGCCPCTVETPAPPASLYHQPRAAPNTQPQASCT